jgi:hypothetical protein
LKQNLRSAFQATTLDFFIWIAAQFLEAIAVFLFRQPIFHYFEHSLLLPSSLFCFKIVATKPAKVNLAENT